LAAAAAGEFVRRMPADEAKRVMESLGWRLDSESDSGQTWTREDGEFRTSRVIPIRSGIADEVRDSRSRQ
jgi:hypothetical protein